MTDIRLALMCGTSIPIPELQASIHQPKIKEIALLGESDFFIGVQCLNINKDFVQQDKILLENTNNFQIFMMIMSEKETKDKKIATQQLLSLLFPDYDIMIMPRSISLYHQVNKTSTVIDENNFDKIQNVVKEIFCISNANNQQAGFNPANDKAKEIAEKLMRGRKRVAEQNGSANASIFSQYLSILSVGLKISLQDLMDLTMFQLYDLVERYQLYISWDIDIRSRLAGAKPDERPDNWMKNIH